MPDLRVSEEQVEVVMTFTCLSASISTAWHSHLKSPGGLIWPELPCGILAEYGGSAWHFKQRCGSTISASDRSPYMPSRPGLLPSLTAAGLIRLTNGAWGTYRGMFICKSERLTLLKYRSYLLTYVLTCICGVCWLDHITNVEIVHQSLDNHWVGYLTQFGHVAWMDHLHDTSCVLRITVPRSTKWLQGRPRSMWISTVEKDLAVFNIGFHRILKKAENRENWEWLVYEATLPRRSMLQKRKKKIAICLVDFFF